MRKTPFIVALNKCDRLFEWKSTANGAFRESLEQQPKNTIQEFDNRVRDTVTLFAEQGLNCCLYWDNKDFRKTVSLVPTSAITGEGIPDLLMLLVQLCQKMMDTRLAYISSLQCTVLEVKVVEGLGTTIDVILANGVLHEGDTIVLCGLQGPIVTTIRALLTPQPLKELRVKGDYVHHKSVKAAVGLKISAQNLENAVAGSQLLVLGPRDDLEELKDEVMQDLATILSRIDKSGKGVCVQASTLGSLEALLSFLKDSNIPVSGINIGPVHKKDVMKASIMKEKKPEYCVILAFDVPVSGEATKWATDLGVEIFTADIIYHLFDKCTAYMKDVRQRKIDSAAGVTVFPMVAEVLPNCIFRARDPMILGCRIVDGLCKIGTPLVIPSKDFTFIGRITSIQFNHNEVKEAKKGDEVCLKIEADAGQQKVMFGRQFDIADQLVSRLTRESIDQLKLNFKDDLGEDDWRLVIKLKKTFMIM
jgi:translation initiation factor 5B